MITNCLASVSRAAEQVFHCELTLRLTLPIAIYMNRSLFSAESHVLRGSDHHVRIHSTDTHTSRQGKPLEACSLGLHT